MAINRQDWLRSVVPAGTVIAFAGTTAPSGWILCDGSAVSRTTYSSLFAAIGVAHGSGDGSTTFHLPDYRGRFLRGVDGTAGNDPDKLTRTAMAAGGNTGNAVGSVQSDSVQGHNHGHEFSGYQGSLTGSPNYIGFNSGSNQGHGGYPAYSNPNNDGRVAVSPHGTPRISSESRSKNSNVNYIIKA